MIKLKLLEFWFLKLTCVEGSGSKTGSVLSLCSLFNKIFNNCGGKIGGPPVPGPPTFVSVFGLF